VSLPSVAACGIFKRRWQTCG